MLKLHKMCTSLLLAASLTLGAGTASAEVVFRDTDNHWAKTTIEWGVTKGIATGYGNGTFMPNQNVTEAEFIRMLIVGITGKDLENTFIAERWSDKYYNLLHFRNYPVNGYADIELRGKFITRQHVAELVSSADGVNYNDDQAIQYVLGKKYALGRIPGENTVHSFMGYDTITRAEALQLIRNLVNHGMTNLYERPVEPTSAEKLPKLPTGWDVFRDEMHMVIRQKVFAKYDGYRIYDDGNSKIVMTKSEQLGQTDYAVSVEFEQQIKAFSGVSITDITDKQQRGMLIDVLNLYGFKADNDLLAKVDAAVKNKKEAELLVSGKKLVIAPKTTSPTGQVTIYYKWWDTPRS
ncbi:S-layer homology domain-containing protein [Paenibacillus albiflavus]|uniref:S-layer homology domain-containing protein n=1 Tax=Paenibacillus albiflavus TaxID=2545760 RepID=A0A4R4DYY1_9BACL|nr:S-layer homology domain-containing protein [Paenibacillus albiflavus]TCZ71057.1 S-layer homology domain-containing protein [Paenibacillus albiflavus]